MRRHPIVFAFVTAPVDTPTLSPFPYCPLLACSLLDNSIGDEGASAFAAVLKETQIIHLKCAAALECLRSCQHQLKLNTSLLSLLAV